LALIFRTPPVVPEQDRLGPERLARLRELLRSAGLDPRAGPAADAKLAELRGLYEPFVNALAGYFLFALPPVVPDRHAVDNWQTAAWRRRPPAVARLAAGPEADDHFD